MPIPKTDFHRIFVEEGKPFYNDIYSLRKDDFNEWVVTNFSVIKTISSFKEVAPNNKLFSDLQVKGYFHREGQCHYSSKAVSILDENFEYWTGFVHWQNWEYPIITHSFNICGGAIIDFSKINEEFKIIEEVNSYLPHVYYGIRIPVEFVRKFKNETFNDYSMKPLLFEWYKEFVNK